MTRIRLTWFCCCCCRRCRCRCRRHRHCWVNIYIWKHKSNSRCTRDGFLTHSAQNLFLFLAICENATFHTYTCKSHCFGWCSLIYMRAKTKMETFLVLLFSTYLRTLYEYRLYRLPVYALWVRGVGGGEVEGGGLGVPLKMLSHQSGCWLRRFS